MTTKSGFTLIEVLIAIVVLAIGILGLVALLPTSVKSAAGSADSLG